MNCKFTKSIIKLIGLVSAVSLATLSLENKSAVAQTPSIIAVDGNLNEYSPSTAPLLRRGIRSSTVQDVQLLLQRLGFYYGRIDGIYGAQTASGVITFQRSRNLIANGAVDSRTWQALINASNRISPTPVSNLNQYSPQTAPVLRIGSRGQVVRDIQGFLKQKGFYTGAVDGIYGNATATAVEAFQRRDARVRNDGIVGQSTWAAMINAASNPLAIN
ncbi:peptidoglycan binding domain-containing protein [Calothrix sp. NIES-4071]|nr:peptidoglycan binding domain-containing protein [Calothrix sp. NIES-4071]BAZ55145.1 peptidoglycan binding domain-containing protein [Calothrix sp. NIES-4105]